MMLTAPCVMVCVRMLQSFLLASSLAFLRRGQAPWSALVHRDVVHNTTALFVGNQLHLLASPAGLGDHTTQRRSWSEDLIETCTGIPCFLLAIFVLWLNEGHAVRMAQLFSLAQRRLTVVSEGCTGPANLREMVFTTGETTTSETLSLPQWGGIEAPPGSAKLRARMFMHQWVQDTQSNGNTTQHSYAKRWRDEPVDSSRFYAPGGHANPAAPQPFLALQLATTRLGDFHLSNRMLGKLQKWQPRNISPEELQQLPVLAKYAAPVTSTHEGTPAVFFGLHGKPAAPEVGDLLVVFEYVPCGMTTILGVQVDSGVATAPWTMVPLEFVKHHAFVPSMKRASTWTTNLGDAQHETLLGEDEEDEYCEDDHSVSTCLANGISGMMGTANPFKWADSFMAAVAPDRVLVVLEREASQEEALASEHEFALLVVRVLRCVGFLLMYLAAEATMSPLARALSCCWLAGSLLVSVSHCFNCLAACSCGSITVGSAYVCYRPQYCVVLFLWSLAIWAVWERFFRSF